MAVLNKKLSGGLHKCEKKKQDHFPIDFPELGHSFMQDRLFADLIWYHVTHALTKESTAPCHTSGWRGDLIDVSTLERIRRVEP